MKKIQQIKKNHYQRYLKAYTSAAYFLGQQDSELNRYTQRFYNSLPLNFSAIDQNQFATKLSSKNLTLVGDFHTCKFSQKSFLDILNIHLQNNPHQKIIIALEMFQKKFNNLITDFLNGLLSEDLFLDLCSYYKNWGFSWSNYKPIFKYARKNNIKIVGVDTNDRRFSHRDHVIAENIISILHSHPDSKVFILIGECHLAPSHLPEKLVNVNGSAQKLAMDRILQNIDQYYFALMESQHIVPQNMFLQLDSDLYCNINAPAWKKWNSVQKWFEQIDYDDFIEDDEAA